MRLRVGGSMLGVRLAFVAVASLGCALGGWAAVGSTHVGPLYAGRVSCHVRWFEADGVRNDA